MKSSSPLNLEELQAILPEYYSPADRDLVARAFHMAEKAHAAQKRASGEPYINHCLVVAHLLSEYSMPADVMAAGLLHDTVEDTGLSIDTIRQDLARALPAWCRE